MSKLVNFSDISLCRYGPEDVYSVRESLVSGNGAVYEKRHRQWRGKDSDRLSPEKILKRDDYPLTYRPNLIDPYLTYSGSFIFMLLSMVYDLVSRFEEASLFMDDTHVMAVVQKVFQTSQVGDLDIFLNASPDGSSLFDDAEAKAQLMKAISGQVFRQTFYNFPDILEKPEIMNVPVTTESSQFPDDPSSELHLPTGDLEADLTMHKGLQREIYSHCVNMLKHLHANNPEIFSGTYEDAHNLFSKHIALRTNRFGIKSSFSYHFHQDSFFYSVLNWVWGTHRLSSKAIIDNFDLTLTQLYYSPGSANVADTLHVTRSAFDAIVNKTFTLTPAFVERHSKAANSDMSFTQSRIDRWTAIGYRYNKPAKLADPIGEIVSF